MKGERPTWAKKNMTKNSSNGKWKSEKLCYLELSNKANMYEKTIGQIIKESFKDVWIKPILRVFALCLLVAFIWGWIDYIKDSTYGKHAKYLWWERNIPKGYPDTVWETKIIYRDTSFSKSRSSILDKNTTKDNATSVKSINQHGGQTAKEIINNK